MTQIINAMSIDLEHWWCNEFLTKYLPENPEHQIIEATDGLLRLLKKKDTKATFFVLGSVAEKYPDYIKSIHEEGHEISSHSYSHTPVNKLSKSKFEEELKASTRLLKSITHEQPLGFRAPSFSVNQSTSWVFELLGKYGYSYDSSIFPVNTILYGVPKAPLIPYKPDLRDITVNDPEGKIIEFPLTVFKIFTNIPVAGGFYLRLLPYCFFDYAISKVMKSRSTIIYIHPWETYQNTPKLKVPPFVHFEAYHGIGKSLEKIKRLLEKYRFTTVRNVLKV